MSVRAKCDDLCQIKVDDQSHDGYVPQGLNLDYLMKGGDYLGFKVCANCGHLIGKWPLPSVLHFEEEDEDDDDESVEDSDEEELKVKVEPIKVSDDDWSDEDSVS
jgi:hypothetical protein